MTSLGTEYQVTTARHPLALFFDGECCFCNRWVARVMRADVERRTRFGAKQGETFRHVAQMHPEASNVESVVVLQRDSGGIERVLIRSAAVAVVIDGLPGYELFSAVLRITPRPLAEFGYFIISKLRTVIFGRQNVCDVVKPQDRELFLD